MVIDMPNDETLEKYAILNDAIAIRPAAYVDGVPKRLVQEPINPTWTGKNRLIGTAFTSIHEMTTAAESTDNAVVIPLWYEPDDEVFVKADRFFGVMNTGTLGISAVVRGRYTVLNHRDAVNIVSGALGEYKEEAIGSLKDYRDVIALDLCFPNMVVNTRVGPIVLGARVINSYDYTRTFNGYSYCYFGKIPLNVSRIVGTARFSSKHTKNIAEISKMRALLFLNRLRDARKALGDTIENAAVRTFNVETPEDFYHGISVLLGSKRAAKRVIELYFNKFEEWDYPQNMGAWDFYIKLSQFIHEDQNASERSVMNASDNLSAILLRAMDFRE